MWLLGRLLSLPFYLPTLGYKVMGRRKKRPGPKRKPGPKPRNKNPLAFENIDRIFSTGTNDFSYVKESLPIYWLHRRYINACWYVNELPYEVKDGPYAGRKPKLFFGFIKRYKFIYNWWIHIIRSCLDPSYPFYKFFGGKGITVSIDFLDSKVFCKWALRVGLTKDMFTFKQYLVRDDKSKGFYRKNLTVTSEEEVHACKSVKQVLKSVQLIKEYEEDHDETVSYLTFYTRYYMYDLDSYDARHLKYNRNIMTVNSVDKLGFLPKQFYTDMATDESCSFTTFMSRMHYSYLNGGFIARPHDMLKPDYSVSEEANKQNKLSYKQQYHRDLKDKEKNNNPYNFEKSDDLIQQTSECDEFNVYNYDSDSDVYSK